MSSPLKNKHFPFTLENVNSHCTWLLIYGILLGSFKSVGKGSHRTDVFSLSRNSLGTDVISLKFVIQLAQRCFRIRGRFRNGLLAFFFLNNWDILKENLRILAISKFHGNFLSFYGHTWREGPFSQHFIFFAGCNLLESFLQPH